MSNDKINLTGLLGNFLGFIFLLFSIFFFLQGCYEGYKEIKADEEFKKTAEYQMMIKEQEAKEKAEKERIAQDKAKREAEKAQAEMAQALSGQDNTEWARGNIHAIAHRYAEGEIARRLKLPKTARFVSEDDIEIYRIDENTYTLWGWIDTENPPYFGYYTRTHHWYVKMRMEEDGWKYLEVIIRNEN